MPTEVVINNDSTRINYVEDYKKNNNNEDIEQPNGASLDEEIEEPVMLIQVSIWIEVGVMWFLRIWWRFIKRIFYNR